MGHRGTVHHLLIFLLATQSLLFISCQKEAEKPAILPEVEKEVHLPPLPEKIVSDVPPLPPVPVDPDPGAPWRPKPEPFIVPEPDPAVPWGLYPEVIADSNRWPDPYEVIDLGQEPNPINLKEYLLLVQYTRIALEMGIKGKVVFRIAIDEKGIYHHHIVLKSPHPMLTNVAEKPLPMLKFTPGILGGKAVKCWVTIPVPFGLDH